MNSSFQELILALSRFWVGEGSVLQQPYDLEVGAGTMHPYGLERITMFLGLEKSIYDIEWVPGGLTYGQVRHQEEYEQSKYYFELADVSFLQMQLDGWEREAKRCLEHGLVLPAYEGALKCSHLFNVLDARGAVSVTERVAMMKRVRD